MTQQSILHLVVNWEVFTINIKLSQNLYEVLVSVFTTVMHQQNIKQFSYLPTLIRFLSPEPGKEIHKPNHASNW